MAVLLLGSLDKGRDDRGERLRRPKSWPSRGRAWRLVEIAANPPWASVDEDEDLPVGVRSVDCSKLSELMEVR